jgi:glycosyltransferase involved in cell wall biosynthesis
MSGAKRERKMRVLYFAPKECWPATTGALVRNYYLARALARHADITYLSFSDNGNREASRLSPHSLKRDRNHNGDLASPNNGNGALDWCDQLIAIPQERAYTPMKLARGALGRTPVTVLNYTSCAMATELEGVLNSREFDIVQIESVHLAKYLPVIHAAHHRPLVICDWHNIESDLMRQYGRRVASALRRAYAQRTANQISVLERDMAQSVDCNLMVSTPDLDRLRAFAPNAPAFVIENGVDVSHFADEEIERAYKKWRERKLQENGSKVKATHEPSQRNRILFVGSMDYHANVEGIVNFARTTWPNLFKLLPDMRLTIAGRNPAAEVRQLTDMPSVEVTGTVEDMRPFYREALVSIVPLNVGGGSRLKICEAMAAGVPVISTRRGAEGIEVTDHENILLAETGDEFCRTVWDIAADPNRRQELADAGRALVREKYDWAGLGDTLAGLYDELLRNRNGS